MKKTALVVLLSLFLVGNAFAVLVSGVDEYQTPYGCAPTAAASLLSYYGLPVDTSLLATAMGTSGTSTNVMNIAPGIVSYTQQQGYEFTATTLDYREFSWLDYTNTIDAGKPMLMSVDSNGDWNVDHEVISIGYDMIGGNPYYGFYTGWEDTERVQWEPFTWSVFNTACWGIGFITMASPVYAATPRSIDPSPVPEPSTCLLLGLGLIGVFKFRNKF